MRLFLFTGLTFVLVAGGAVAENFKDRQLIDLFSKTCLRTPALPSELERIASEAGFANTGPEIHPQYANGPEMDVLYLGKLFSDAEVSLSGHFSGDFQRPTVTCTAKSSGTSTDGIEDLVEHSFQAYDRTTMVIAEGAGRLTKWRLQAKNGEGILEVRSYQVPPRSSITISYQGRDLPSGN